VKYRSIHEFANLKGNKRRVIHAPGALNSWEVTASGLSPRKAAEIEGFLIGLFEAWIEIRSSMPSSGYQSGPISGTR
jgi:hypothetical protein